jgi:hypothetical protein
MFIQFEIMFARLMNIHVGDKMSTQYEIICHEAQGKCLHITQNKSYSSENKKINTKNMNNIEMKRGKEKCRKQKKTEQKTRQKERKILPGPSYQGGLRRVGAN